MRCVFDADTVAGSTIESYVTWEHELFVYLSIHGKHDHLMFAIYIQGSKKNDHRMINSIEKVFVSPFIFFFEFVYIGKMFA